METYIYMPPVKIGDSFQKHKIELIRQKEKKANLEFGFDFVSYVVIYIKNFIHSPKYNGTEGCLTTNT